jgi:hypothetical protein
MVRCASMMIVLPPVPVCSYCDIFRHIVDRESAERLNPFIQDALFIMVAANSCANPLVYGVFHSGGSGNCRRGSSSSSPHNNINNSAYTMSTYHRRSTITNLRSVNKSSRNSIQTETNLASRRFPLHMSANRRESMFD